MNIFKYIPKEGFFFDSHQIKWGQSREIVRQVLNAVMLEDDKLIDLSEYHLGDSSFNISQKRDIYKSLNDVPCYFFLNYDDNNSLRDFEIHDGIEIELNNIKISFGKNFESIITDLKHISSNWKLLGETEYLFIDFNLVLASNSSNGGHETELGYIYCSKDISHLL